MHMDFLIRMFTMMNFCYSLDQCMHMDFLIRMFTMRLMHTHALTVRTPCSFEIF